MKQFFIFLWEVIEIAAIAFVSVFVIRTFVVQPFLVRGASMEPNYSNGDYLLVDEISMRFREPERGEVIVFRFPRDTTTFYIKRVVGLPNETVTIRDNRVFIDSENYQEEFGLNEEYVRPDGVTGEGETTYELRDDEYLVFGDNRSYSYDSRTWGPVTRDKIVGLARLRLWPISNFSLFEAPVYELAQ